MGLVSSVINFNPILSSNGFVLIFRNTGITARLKFFHDAVKKYNDTFSHVPKTTLAETGSLVFVVGVIDYSVIQYITLKAIVVALC